MLWACLGFPERFIQWDHGERSFFFWKSITVCGLCLWSDFENHCHHDVIYKRASLTHNESENNCWLYPSVMWLTCKQQDTAALKKTSAAHLAKVCVQSGRLRLSYLHETKGVLCSIVILNPPFSNYCSPSKDLDEEQCSSLSSEAVSGAWRPSRSAAKTESLLSFSRLELKCQTNCHDSLNVCSCVCCPDTIV